jgi:hypothetical protein
MPHRGYKCVSAGDDSVCRSYPASLEIFRLRRDLSRGL